MSGAEAESDGGSGGAPGGEGPALHSPWWQNLRGAEARAGAAGGLAVCCGATCPGEATGGGCSWVDRRAWGCVWGWLWWGDGMRPSGECRQGCEAVLSAVSVAGWGDGEWAAGRFRQSKTTTVLRGTGPLCLFLLRGQVGS